MLGERLKKARLNKGLTQEALAAELDLTAPAISQYETEERLPSLDVFLRMIDILNVAPEYILGRDMSVTSDNTPYTIHLANDDIRIINEIKKYDLLYKRLSEDTERLVASWNKKVG